MGQSSSAASGLKRVRSGNQAGDGGEGVDREVHLLKKLKLDGEEFIRNCSQPSVLRTSFASWERVQGQFKKQYTDEVLERIYLASSGSEDNHNQLMKDLRELSEKVERVDLFASCWIRRHVVPTGRRNSLPR